MVVLVVMVDLERSGVKEDVVMDRRRKRWWWCRRRMRCFFKKQLSLRGSLAMHVSLLMENL